METSVDRFGRIVIPKKIREDFNLESGTPLRIEENEQSIIGIEHSKGKLLFKQIAGIIARRIVYHVELGDKVSAGQRFGLIRYGSRVDVYFPENTSIKVKLNDKVVGGETILGEFTSR